MIEAYRDGGGRVTLAIHNCPKPTVMAVNGTAAGFGITFTLPAAIRVAYADSKVSFAFARRGLVMEACSSYFLSRLVGMSHSLHVVTTGSTYSASDPLLRGIFSELLPTPIETVSRALTIAEDIATNTSTISTTVMRDLMYRGPSSPEKSHLLESKLFLTTLLASDSAEGIRSFMERREPDFKGSMTRDAPLGWPWWSSNDISTETADGRQRKL